MAMKRERSSIDSNTSEGISETKEEVDYSKVHLLGTSLTDLSYDIVTNILLKLPIKPLLICKRVCKSWHSIISDSHFAELHFEHAPISILVRTSNYRHVSRTLHLLDFDEFQSSKAQNSSGDNDCGLFCSCMDSPKPNCNNHLKPEVKFKLPLRDSKMVLDKMLDARKSGAKRTYIPMKPTDDKFDVVNSCNGLLCLCDPIERNPLVICNPITGEFIRLPQSENEKLMRHPCIFSGFGYLKKTNEYKVIRIYEANDYTVEIHTLRTRLWRNIEHHGLYYWSEVRYPTCLNGSLYWLVYDYLEVSILCFDLENETFNSFPCPSELSSVKNFDRIGFGELKGSCLYICCPYNVNPNCLRLWTMKMYGSWSEVFSFNTNNSIYWPYLYQPMMGYTGDGILVYHNPGRYFIYFEPQKHSLRFLEVRGKPLFKLKPIFHRPSLIRLKDAVKGDNIEVLNVHSRCGTFKLREEDKGFFYLAKYLNMLFDHHGEEFSFLRS